MRALSNVTFFALAISALSTACAEAPPTRWCALLIKHQFADYDCPYSFYIRWSDTKEFKRTTLLPGKSNRYSVSCRGNDPCDGQLQVQFDTSGDNGLRTARYWLSCITSGSDDGPAAKYVFHFRGTDPALDGTIDSLDIAQRRFVDDGPSHVYYFTHPSLMKPGSGPPPPLPPGAKISNCNPW